MVGVDILELIGGAIAQMRALRLENVGDLEAIIPRLDDKQRRSDEWEHVLSHEADVGLIAILLDTALLRERC